MPDLLRRIACGLAGGVAIMSLVNLILASICEARWTCKPLPHDVQLTMLVFAALGVVGFLLTRRP